MVRVFPLVPLNGSQFYEQIVTKLKTKSTVDPHEYISWYSGIRQHLKSEVIDYIDFVFDMRRIVFL